MNELQIFNNPEFGQIRIIEIDGDPWFVGRDVAAALGYNRPHDAVYRHVEEDDAVMHSIPDSNGRTQKTKLINESGLYALIFMSELPSAKKFRRWIYKEVLPSIAKTGSYTLPQLTPNELILKIAESNLQLEKRIEQNEVQLMDTKTRLAVLEAKTPEIVEPDPQYYLEATNNHLSKNIYTMKEIAKAFGMSNVVLNKFLHTQGIIYPSEGGWRVNKKKCEEGYVKHEYGRFKQKDGKYKTVLYTYWTHWGMTFLVTYLKSLGFVMTCSIQPYDRKAFLKKKKR